MYKYNYDKLMSANPTVFERFTNSKNQEIELVENPWKGDESFVIAVCHELKLAEDTTFFECEDMVQDHKEYEPTFEDGVLFIGGSSAH